MLKHASSWLYAIVVVCLIAAVFGWVVVDNNNQTSNKQAIQTATLSNVGFDAVKLLEHSGNGHYGSNSYIATLGNQKCMVEITANYNLSASQYRVSTLFMSPGDEFALGKAIPILEEQLQQLTEERLLNQFGLNQACVL